MMTFDEMCKALGKTRATLYHWKITAEMEPAAVAVILRQKATKKSMAAQELQRERRALNFVADELDPPQTLGEILANDPEAFTGTLRELLEDGGGDE